MNTDPVNHPSHYLAHPSGIECIEVTRYMGFCLGNAIKYIWRDGQKAGEDVNDDLRKAIWYIQCEIDRRVEKIESEKEDLVTKSVSSPNLTGNTLAYAQAGDARRQNQMGLMCYHGDCMPQDYEAAVEWWQKAADQGNYDAQLSLVKAYRNGEGVVKDEKLANYWLEKSFHATS